MNTHTPAPWMLSKAHDARVDLINTRKGEAIGEIVFADVRNPADARLIAAAPDMLDALLLALPYVEDVLDSPEQLACFKSGVVQSHAKAIRAAIAKATGEAP